MSALTDLATDLMDWTGAHRSRDWRRLAEDRFQDLPGSVRAHLLSAAWLASLVERFHRWAHCRHHARYANDYAPFWGPPK